MSTAVSTRTTRRPVACSDAGGAPRDGPGGGRAAVADQVVEAHEHVHRRAVAGCPRRLLPAGEPRQRRPVREPGGSRDGHDAGGRDHRRRGCEDGQTGDRRDRGHCEHRAGVDATDRRVHLVVHVAGDPGQQLAAGRQPASGDARHQQRPDLHPTPGELAERRVVRQQPLAVAQRRAAERERPHRHDVEAQREQGRPVCGPDEQSGGRGGQRQPAQRGQHAAGHGRRGEPAAGTSAAGPGLALGEVLLGSTSRRAPGDAGRPGDPVRGRRRRRPRWLRRRRVRQVDHAVGRGKRGRPVRGHQDDEPVLAGPGHQPLQHQALGRRVEVRGRLVEDQQRARSGGRVGTGQGDETQLPGRQRRAEGLERAVEAAVRLVGDGPGPGGVQGGPDLGVRQCGQPAAHRVAHRARLRERRLLRQVAEAGRPDRGPGRRRQQPGRDPQQGALACPGPPADRGDRAGGEPPGDRAEREHAATGVGDGDAVEHRVSGHRLTRGRGGRRRCRPGQQRLDVAEHRRDLRFGVEAAGRRERRPEDLRHDQDRGERRRQPELAGQHPRPADDRDQPDRHRRHQAGRGAGEHRGAQHAQGQPAVLLARGLDPGRPLVRAAVELEGHDAGHAVEERPAEPSGGPPGPAHLGRGPRADHPREQRCGGQQGERDQGGAPVDDEKDREGDQRYGDGPGPRRPLPGDEAVEPVEPAGQQAGQPVVDVCAVPGGRDDHPVLQPLLRGRAGAVRDEPGRGGRAGGDGDEGGGAGQRAGPERRAARREPRHRAGEQHHGTEPGGPGDGGQQRDGAHRPRGPRVEGDKPAGGAAARSPCRRRVGGRWGGRCPRVVVGRAGCGRGERHDGSRGPVAGTGGGGTGRPAAWIGTSGSPRSHRDSAQRHAVT